MDEDFEGALEDLDPNDRPDDSDPDEPDDDNRIDQQMGEVFFCPLLIRLFPSHLFSLPFTAAFRFGHQT